MMFTAESPGIDLPPRPLRWLFLDLNSYFASVEQQLQPALRGRPMIVAPVGSDTTVAIAASKEAKRFGITTGTPVWEAKRRCPEIVVTPARHDRYVAFHDAIVAEVWRHVPVMRVCSIDEMACRLLDNENDRAAAEALALRIKAGIRANVGDQLTCSVGIAPNRLLAKLASDLQKPDGLVVFQSQDLPHALYPLTLREISGIGAKMERRLQRDGINDLRQLCERTPRDAGTAWGGTNGDRLWYLLHGVDLPERATQSRTIGHSHVLSPQHRGPESARLTARRLALKAASRLRRKRYRARLLVLHAKFDTDANGDRSSWRTSIKLPATDDSFVVLSHLDRLFPRLHAVAQARVGGFRLRMVGVTLAEIEAVAGEQGTLFAHLDPDDPLARETRGAALSRAMDSINGRWGRNAVSVGPLNGGRLDRIGTKIAFGFPKHPSSTNSCTLISRRLTCINPSAKRRRAMKSLLPLPALTLAAAILSLTACNQPQPEVVDTNPDPMAAELANRPAVALPPAIRAEKSFRCGDNSLVYVNFFQGDTQVNVRLVQGGPPTVLRAPAAGQPYVADGGWSLTGDETKITLLAPGLPSRTCHL